MKQYKKKGYLLIGFAILYFVYTAFIVKHGMHFINIVATIGILIWAVMMLKKK